MFLELGERNMTRLSLVEEVLARGPRESGSRGTWGQSGFRT